MVNAAGGHDELSLLQRLASRLCVAFDGVDQELDVALHEIKRGMRQPAGAPELERLLQSLTDGIRRSDDARAAKPKPRPAAAVVNGADSHPPEPPAPPGPPPPPGPSAPPPKSGPAGDDCSGGAPESSCNAPLLHLVDRLDLLPHLQMRMIELREAIRCCQSVAELVRSANPVAALINQQRADLQRERNGVTAVLEQVAQRLEEMTQHLTETTALQVAADEDSSELNTHLLQEFDALGASARDAGDLEQFQQQLSLRLEIIGTHLKKFRDRELERWADYKARAERMTSRVSELERETHELQRRVDREQRRAYTDPLTEIPNRLAFQQRLNEEFAHWKRSGIALCVAFWDIDSFKSINDNFGHPAGDKAIRIVAQHLARSLRKSDFVARYGGEEFVVILRGMPLGDAIHHADRIRQSLEQLGIHFEQRRIPITASCGLAAVRTEDTEEHLIQRADAALYQAKKNGRNRCVAA